MVSTELLRRLLGFLSMISIRSCCHETCTCPDTDELCTLDRLVTDPTAPGECSRAPGGIITTDIDLSGMEAVVAVDLSGLLRCDGSLRVWGNPSLQDTLFPSLTVSLFALRSSQVALCVV